jgi:hypothetical protein
MIESCSKPLLRVALHEAAHAVMYAWLNLDDLDYVTVVPERRGHEGIAHKFLPSNGIRVRKEILMLMAGGQGELLYPRARQPRELQDWLRARTLAAEYLFRGDTDRAVKYVRLAERRAQRLVRGSLRAPIRDFAHILMDRMTIEREDAEHILAKLLGRSDYWSRVSQATSLSCADVAQMAEQRFRNSPNEFAPKFAHVDSREFS